MSPTDIATWMAVIAAGIAGLGYLFKTVRGTFKTLEALERIVSNELQHNGGHSIKDRAVQAADSAARTEQKVDTLAAELRAHLADADSHVQRDLAQMRSDIADGGRHLRAHIAEGNRTADRLRDDAGQLRKDVDHNHDDIRDHANDDDKHP